MEYILFYGKARTSEVNRIEAADFKSLTMEFLHAKKKSDTPLDAYLCADIGEWIRVR
ncbi:MAG: hypothetical protein JRN20_13170 [Nitrososphaerota archaeon]|nr:hypothetical protein [Nitrososphaerota archaeon]